MMLKGSCVVHECSDYGTVVEKVLFTLPSGTEWHEKWMWAILQQQTSSFCSSTPNVHSFEKHLHSEDVICGNERAIHNTVVLLHINSLN